MSKKIIALLSIFMLGLLSGCAAEDQMDSGRTQQNGAQQNGKLAVVTSFYPLFELAQSVGGDKVKAANLVPPGSEPHDYEPSPKDIAALYEADLVILNGAGFEPWAESIHDELEKKGVKILSVSDSIPDLIASEEYQEEHGLYDPHFWLDPLSYKNEAKIISGTLSQMDAANASYYEERLQDISKKLDALHAQYHIALKSCKQRTVVTSHNAFAYLAKRYNLQILPISGLSPDEEPSAARLAELTVIVKTKGIKYIFTETLVSPKIADTLAAEAGVKTLVLNPLEGLTTEEIQNGQNYFSVMEKNLGNLKIALECS